MLGESKNSGKDLQISRDTLDYINRFDPTEKHIIGGVLNVSTTSDAPKLQPRIAAANGISGAAYQIAKPKEAKDSETLGVHAETRVPSIWDSPEFIVPDANLFSDNDGAPLGKPNIEVPASVGEEVPSKAQERAVYKSPRQIDIPPEHTIPVPQTILDQVAAKEREGKRSIHIRDVDIAPTADTKTSQTKGESNPYEIDASDEYLYVKSRTIKDPEYPDAPLHFFRLGHENGKITSIIPVVDESMFRVAMADFSKDTIVGRVRDSLGIAEPSAYDRQKYEQIAAEAKKSVETQNELRRLSNKNLFSGIVFETPENTSRIYDVEQGTYSVATNQELDWLVTFGAAPCYIVSLYDREKQKGAVAHIDETVDGVATFEEMAYSLSLDKDEQDTNKSRYQVTISGGANESFAYVIETYERIRQWKTQYGDALDVIVGPVIGSGESLALNLTTGELKEFKPLESDEPDYELRHMQVTVRALASAFEGKKSARFSYPQK